MGAHEPRIGIVGDGDVVFFVLIYELDGTTVVEAENQVAPSS